MKMGGMAMNCMKCGREIDAEQVFCAACLEEMEKYPVRQGVAILIPNRPEETSRKPAPRKRTLTAEEQLIRMKRLVRRLAILLAAAILALAAVSVGAGLLIDELELKQFIGKNYTAIVSPKQDGAGNGVAGP
jgi:Flp pilus assembly CpaF family ATPase